MKKAIVAGLIAISTVGSVQAHGFHGGYHHGGGGWGWVGPALIGGVIGYEMSRPPVVVQPQPQVIYQQTQTLPAPVYQPEVRVLPQYTPAYPGPNGCFPVYSQQGVFVGQMCR